MQVSTLLAVFWEKKNEIVKFMLMEYKKKIKKNMMKEKTMKQKTHTHKAHQCILYAHCFSYNAYSQSTTNIPQIQSYTATDTQLNLIRCYI